MKLWRGRTSAIAQVLGGLNESEILQSGKKLFDVLVYQS
jgi:hypothetical protein